MQGVSCSSFSRSQWKISPVSGLSDYGMFGFLQKSKNVLLVERQVILFPVGSIVGTNCRMKYDWPKGLSHSMDWRRLPSSVSIVKKKKVVHF